MLCVHLARSDKFFLIRIRSLSTNMRTIEPLEVKEDMKMIAQERHRGPSFFMFTRHGM